MTEAPALVRPFQPPAYSAADFAHALQGLLPTGRAWPRDPDAVQSQVVAALAISYARLNNRANALIADAFPSTTVGLLPEWELALGLPDPCAGPEPTIALRQQSVVAQFIATGGQSIPYFVSLAAALGYAITVTEFAPARAGIMVAGDPVNGPDWAYAWQVNMPPVVVTNFEAGSGRAGDPLSSWGVPTVECTLRRYGPAHAVIVFAYADGARIAAP